MNSEKIKQLQRLVRSKKARMEEQKIVIEGDKVVEELYRKNKLLTLITDDSSWQGRKGAVIVKPEVISKISSCQTPQHHLGIAELPKEAVNLGKHVLVLDRLQDPGNVGTLIRTALSLGWEGVFLIEPVCDLFNDKALRSSRGAILEIPYQVGNVSRMLQEAKKGGAQVVVADLEGQKPAFEEKGTYLVLGSEGVGVQKIPCDKKVTIPMEKRFESLNVASAGSILLYVLRHR